MPNRLVEIPPESEKPHVNIGYIGRKDHSKTTLRAAIEMVEERKENTNMCEVMPSLPDAIAKTIRDANKAEEERKKQLVNDLDPLTESMVAIHNPKLAFEVTKEYYDILTTEQFKRLQSVILTSDDPHLVFEFLDEYDDSPELSLYEDYFIQMKDDMHLFQIAVDYKDANILKIAEALASFGADELLRSLGKEFTAIEIQTTLARGIIEHGYTEQMISAAYELENARDELLKAIVKTGNTDAMCRAMLTIRINNGDLTPSQDEMLYQGIISSGDVERIIHYAEYLEHPCETITDFVFQRGSMYDVLNFAIQVKWSDKKRAEDFLIEHGNIHQLSEFAKCIPEADKKRIWEKIKTHRVIQNNEYQTAKRICRHSSQH